MSVKKLEQDLNDILEQYDRNFLSKKHFYSSGIYLPRKEGGVCGIMAHICPLYDAGDFKLITSVARLIKQDSFRELIQNLIDKYEID